MEEVTDIMPSKIAKPIIAKPIYLPCDCGAALIPTIGRNMRLGKVLIFKCVACGASSAKSAFVNSAVAGSFKASITTLDHLTQDKGQFDPAMWDQLVGTLIQKGSEGP